MEGVGYFVTYSCNYGFVRVSSAVRWPIGRADGSLLAQKYVASMYLRRRQCDGDAPAASSTPRRQPTFRVLAIERKGRLLPAWERARASSCPNLFLCRPVWVVTISGKQRESSPLPHKAPMRILLAEDDTRLAEPLAEFLEREQHAVTWVSDGRVALRALLQDPYDLALLDWMLPGRDGLTIVEELRRQQSPTLVLMLTARDSLEDVVKGLQSGADDYLVKPFRMAELAARVRSLERRADRPYTGRQLQWGPLLLDGDSGRVSVDGVPLPLTARERQLLEWFLRHPGRLVSRVALLDQIWSMEAEAGEETVKTHLNNLRRKLRAADSPDPIETVHGQGYRLLPPP